MEDIENEEISILTPRERQKIGTEEDIFDKCANQPKLFCNTKCQTKNSDKIITQPETRALILKAEEMYKILNEKFHSVFAQGTCLEMETLRTSVRISRASHSKRMKRKPQKD